MTVQGMIKECINKTQIKAITEQMKISMRAWLECAVDFGKDIDELSEENEKLKERIAELQEENEQLKRQYAFLSNQICHKECREVWGENSEAKKIIIEMIKYIKGGYVQNGFVDIQKELIEKAEAFLNGIE